MTTTSAEQSANHSGNVSTAVYGTAPAQAVREVDPDTLNRLRLMQLELVEATNTAQLLQQVKELKQERFQLFLELVAARQGIDLRREEIRLADGRVVPRDPAS